MNKNFIATLWVAFVVLAGFVYRHSPGSGFNIAESNFGWSEQSGSRRNLDKSPNSRIHPHISTNTDQYHQYIRKDNANPKRNNTPYSSKKKLAPSPPERSDKTEKFVQPQPIWQRWKTLLARSDYQQIPIVNAALSQALQQNPDPRIYDAITVMLGQAELPNDKKALILDLLSEIATPEALQLLLALAEQGMESTLYLQVLQAISRIGDNRWQGRYHNELSAVLLPAWQESKNNDPSFYNAISKAIAGVGEPQGVNQLLIALTSQVDNDLNEGIKRIKQQAAFNAIPQIRNPDAVEVLGSWLASENIGTPTFEVSGTALAEIGSPEAMEKIIVWAKSAPSEGVRNLQDWLPKIDDIDELQSIAASESQNFQSPEIEATVTEFAASSSTPNLKPNPSPSNDAVNTLQNTSTMTGAEAVEQ